MPQPIAGADKRLPSCFWGWKKSAAPGLRRTLSPAHAAQLRVVSKRKKLLVALIVLIAIVLVSPLVVWFGVLPVEYFRVGRPSYSKARSVADSFMSKSANGPWEHANESFILEIDFTRTNFTRWDMITGEPRWVFRYRNPTTGQESVRIYVRIPEYEVHHTAIGLDEIPLHGSLPR